MATTVLEMLGTVRSDGTLDLDHKVPVPPGRVRVRVEPVESPAPPAQGLVQFVQSLRQEMAAAGHQFRDTTGLLVNGRPEDGCRGLRRGRGCGTLNGFGATTWGSAIDEAPPVSGSG